VLIMASASVWLTTEEAGPGRMLEGMKVLVIRPAAGAPVPSRFKLLPPGKYWTMTLFRSRSDRAAASAWSMD
jgi:hypothetical protein